MDANLAALEDYTKRFKKGISILTLSIDDNLVELLNSVPRHPAEIWEKIERDYNKVSAGATQQVKQELRDFSVDPKEDSVKIQHRLELLVGKCRQKKYFPDDEDVAMVMLDALDDSCEALRNTYWASSPLPSIDWIYSQIEDRHRRQKKSHGVAHGAALLAFVEKKAVAAEKKAFADAKAYYGGGGGRGGRSDRGRGRIGPRGGGRSGGGGRGDADVSYKCGNLGHYGKDCQHKDKACSYCGGIGHLEKLYFDNVTESREVNGQPVGVY